MSTVTSSNTRSPWAFMVLTVVLWVPLVVIGSAPLGLPVNLPLAGLATACPLLAALVLVGRSDGARATGSFLSGIVTLRGAGRSVRATAVAVGLVPACLAVSAAVTTLARGAAPFDAPATLASLPPLAALFLLAAMAEEAGWTGYVLEPLHRRWGGLGAALAIGALSAALHLYGWSEQTGHGWAFTAGMTVSTVTLRLVAVRLWELTGRAVGTPVLLHASINVCSLPFAPFYDPVVVAALTVPVALACARPWAGTRTA